MTINELNEYIKRYIENNHTRSAIMLTAGWGTGKSYYIQNNLIPYLADEKNGQHKCIVVSLYGVNDISSISKSIYLEVRFKKILNRDSERATTGKLVAKTVVKGFSHYLGIDLNLDEQQFKELYDSIDLRGKLIIFEDIERAHISVLEFLGYVNSLVEQDNVKVLLVANEDELIKYNIVEKTTPENKGTTLAKETARGHTAWKYTEETLKYLETKEKSVSDTLLFEGNLSEAVLQIIQSFDNQTLDKFDNTDSAKDICDIMDLCENHNLRSFIFACQKATDIFESMYGEYDDDFIQCIFFGIVFFSLRLKAGIEPKWTGTENYSLELGHDKFPLFRFCFDYITRQKLDTTKIQIAEEAFLKMRLYDEHKTLGDPDLQVLFNYHINYEADVNAAVQSITKRLNTPEDISFYDYGAIAAYLVVVKHCLGCEIEAAKKSLIKNLQGRGNELQIDALFRTIPYNEDATVQEEFDILRKEMAHALNGGKLCVPGFIYHPNQAKMFYDYAAENHGRFRLRGRFAKDLDAKKLVNMFAQATPEQKNDVRAAFLAVYPSDNIKRYMDDDAQAIEEILHGIEIDQGRLNIDRVEMLQYKWFIKNLNDILRKLS